LIAPLLLLLQLQLLMSLLMLLQLVLGRRRRRRRFRVPPCKLRLHVMKRLGSGFIAWPVVHGFSECEPFQVFITLKE
jgi:hypothetical protein